MAATGVSTLTPNGSQVFGAAESHRTRSSTYSTFTDSPLGEFMKGIVFTGDKAEVLDGLEVRDPGAGDGVGLAFEPRCACGFLHSEGYCGPIGGWQGAALGGEDPLGAGGPQGGAICARKGARPGEPRQHPHEALRPEGLRWVDAKIESKLSIRSENKSNLYFSTFLLENCNQKIILK